MVVWKVANDAPAASDSANSPPSPNRRTVPVPPAGASAARAGREMRITATIANATPAKASSVGRSPRTRPAANVNTAISAAVTGAITAMRPHVNPVYMKPTPSVTAAPARTARSVSRVPPRGCHVASR